MTPEDVVREAREGRLRPVYLLVGADRFQLDGAVRELRAASLGGGLADFNEDSFFAADVGADRVLDAARMVPMMATRRFVLLRGLERWDGDDERSKAHLEKLAAYAERPFDTTCLAITAEKLDGRRRLASLAKKQGFVVTCEPLDNRRLVAWVSRAVAERGAKIAPFVAEVLVQLAGPELSAVADAVDRLCLYVGVGGAIDEDAIAAVVVKLRETNVFDLLTALARRDRAKSMTLLSEVFDPREGPRLLGLFAWSVRQNLRFKHALDAGMRPDEAAKAAGVPPFKARDLVAQLKSLDAERLERWLVMLSDADLALKGSKRSHAAVFEALVLEMSA